MRADFAVSVDATHGDIATVRNCSVPILAVSINAQSSEWNGVILLLVANPVDANHGIRFVCFCSDIIVSCALAVDANCDFAFLLLLNVRFVATICGALAVDTDGC